MLMENQAHGIEDMVFDKDSSSVEEKDLESALIEANLTSSDWTTETILNQIRKGNINLTPDFQRREAWTNDKKSAFIESLFLGLPVPQIMLAEQPHERGSYIVLDGKQRLLAIRRFAASPNDPNGFKPLALSGLQVEKRLEGKTLHDIQADAALSAMLPRYENQTIRSVVVRNWKSEDLLYRIFIRLNTTNLPLSTQELRQALRPGQFTGFANSHESPGIRRALGIQEPDFRMRDVEILVRFFAFHYFIEEYRGNLKKFLDDTCEKLNAQWEVKQGEIKKVASYCDAAIEATFDIFGEKAFRMRESGEYNRPFSRAVFDIMTYYFTNKDTRKKALRQPQNVENTFINLCNNDSDFAGAFRRTTNSVPSTATRLEKWGAALKTTLQIGIQVPSIRKEER